MFRSACSAAINRITEKPMHAIRLRHFRGFSDTGWLDLAPITLLVGQNSSGKSSVLRFFPLLRQSVEANTTGPFLWYGRYVDFGTFADVVNKDADELEMECAFRLVIPAVRFSLSTRGRSRTARSVPGPSRGELLPVTVAMRVRGEPNKEALSLPSSVHIQLSDHIVDIGFDKGGLVKRFTVNDLDVLELGPEDSYEIAPGPGILPVLLPRLGERHQHPSVAFFRHLSLGGAPWVSKALFKTVRPLFHGNTQDSTIRRIISGLQPSSSEDMLAQLKNVRGGGDYFKRKIGRLTVDSWRFKRLRDQIIAEHVGVILDAIDDHLKETASNVTYMAPVRATIERYYRIQGLAVSEVDYEGRNLAMFLRGLSEPERRDFQSWVKEAMGFVVNARMASGHIYLTVTEEGSDAEHNLADVGFGVSQVLPVLAQLWVVIRRARPRGRRRRGPVILAVEQPELHLHPRLQARLAEIFMRAIEMAASQDLDLRIVIETHSEAIVNGLGHGIAAGNFDPGWAKVALFDRRDGKTSVSFSEYNQDGFLKDWPYGFFDSVTA